MACTGAFRRCSGGGEAGRWRLESKVPWLVAATTPTPSRRPLVIALENDEGKWCDGF